MTKKTYKIKAPVGSNILPKDEMTESELRDFFPTIVQDPVVADVWREKASQDPVEELVELLGRAGYQVTEKKQI